MSYLHDKKNKIKKFLFTGLLVVVFVYTILFTGLFDKISYSFGYIASPVWSAQGIILDIWDNIRTPFLAKKTLLEENKKLRDNVAIASAKLLDRNLLFEENIELKELLGRDINEQTVFASVLTKPNRSVYDTIVIDVGENAGIKEGDSVLYGGTIVIGRVSEVLKHTSKVTLLSSPGEVIDIIVGNKNITTTAYGRGGGGFKFEIPRDIEVDIGDVISVPGMVPRVLGKVEYIESRPSDPFKTILFKGPVNIFELKWVEVLI